MQLERIPVFNKMDIEMCCGCEACANSCPKKIIEFREDEEGFRFPYVDNEQCIHCNACINTCPQLRDVKTNVNYRICLAGFAKSEDIVLSSSSGGIFTCLVTEFMSSKSRAAFVGVAWSANYDNACFLISNDLADLEKIKVSKYIQARKEFIYENVRKALDLGNSVLFSGCPCEVAALKSYLKKDYDNLYSVDLVCKGPTSAKVLNEYLDTLSKKEKPQYINFRRVGGKTWIPQWMEIKYDNRKNIYLPFYKTALGQAFKILQRNSCYTCVFCGANRYSDITLGDFHGVNTECAYYNPNGTSVIIVNSEKGMKLIERIKDQCILENVSYDEIIKHNPRIEKAWDADPRRNKFSKVFIKKGLIRAFYAVTPFNELVRMKLSIAKSKLILSMKGNSR